MRWFLQWLEKCTSAATAMSLTTLEAISSSCLASKSSAIWRLILLAYPQKAADTQFWRTGRNLGIIWLFFGPPIDNDESIVKWMHVISMSLTDTETLSLREICTRTLKAFLGYSPPSRTTMNRVFIIMRHVTRLESPLSRRLRIQCQSVASQRMTPQVVTRKVVARGIVAPRPQVAPRADSEPELRAEVRRLKRYEIGSSNLPFKKRQYQTIEH
jgi:hypothetical protein